MTRKMKCHQENFATKNEQHETAYTATGISLINVDDGQKNAIDK